MHILRLLLKPLTATTKKSFALRGFKSGISFLPAVSSLCSDVRWWIDCSLFRTCAVTLIERKELEHRAAAEDCVKVHDTSSDGEVCVWKSCDGKDCWICCMWWFVPKDFALRGFLTPFLWEIWFFFFHPLHCRWALINS